MKILPIVAYGDKVLKQDCIEIDKNYPNLKELIDNMYHSMYAAQGVGLAAPQIGLDIRLFIIDSKKMFEEEEEHLGKKMVFINAEMLEESGKKWDFEEGCLSIPGIREKVTRHEKIKIKFQDENFKEHIMDFDDLNARVIQHEYDHIEGVLFTDHLKPLKKRLLRGKLNDISRGHVDVKYKMKFPG